MARFEGLEGLYQVFETSRTARVVTGNTHLLVPGDYAEGPCRFAILSA